MFASTLIILSSLVLILATVIIKGLPAMNLAMVTQAPKGGFYLGKEGGILNAIVGSLYLATGATFLAILISLPVVLYLNVYTKKGSRIITFTRFSLDVLWGVPSIVLGAFMFIIMLYMRARVSLLWGIITITILELPIMTRAIDEAMKMVPHKLKEASYSLGSTRLETVLNVMLRQALPGVLTAILLAFGRGIGDAASVIFTAGYTDSIPSSLFDPVATLPLAIFFQLGTPFPAVQERAYASALVLTVIVLGLCLISRRLSRHLTKHVIR